MTKYYLFKYDDKQFESGHTIRMYPVKRVELTKKDLKNIYSDTASFKVKDKIRKVLNDEKD